jgi:small subunit ribosomal protein S21
MTTTEETRTAERSQEAGKTAARSGSAEGGGAAEERSEEKSGRQARSSEEPRHDGDGDRRRGRRRNETIGEAVVCRPLEVNVRDDRVEQAVRQLKNRLAREGVLRELKNRRHYFKPSELKRIKRREAARRRRKQARQRKGK